MLQNSQQKMSITNGLIPYIAVSWYWDHGDMGMDYGFLLRIIAMVNFVD